MSLQLTISSHRKCRCRDTQELNNQIYLEPNTQNDGVNDLYDTDDDGEGWTFLAQDSDGIGNNLDEDDDNDGLLVVSDVGQCHH